MKDLYPLSSLIFDRPTKFLLVEGESAHAGNAIITDLNLASAFSGMKIIILGNSEFRLEK